MLYCEEDADVFVLCIAAFEDTIYYVESSWVYDAAADDHSEEFTLKTVGSEGTTSTLANLNSLVPESEDPTVYNMVVDADGACMCNLRSV